jgi:hypothetical protein
VDVFNKRNAFLGFLTLKLVQQRLRRRSLRKKAPRIALFSFVGLASIAAVVGIVAVLLRRRGDNGSEAREETESEIVGEYVTASSDPIPAT